MTASLAESSAKGQHADRQPSLADDLQAAIHLLPSQGPISVFVHHNTLHMFEHEPFEQAVQHAGRLYGSAAFLGEARYRGLLEAHRIRRDDLVAVLREDLRDDRGASGDQPGLGLASRLDVRLAMLEHRHHVGTDEELRWAIADTEALRRFRPSTSDGMRRRSIERTRGWVTQGLGPSEFARDPDVAAVLDELRDAFGAAPRAWDEAAWEPATLQLLWALCRSAVAEVPLPPSPEPGPRHRDLLLAAGGEDIDLAVNEVLVRFCASFLDQGVADWPLPGRERGFLDCFVGLYRSGRAGPPLLDGLGAALRRLQASGVGALDSVSASLTELGVSDDERQAYLAQTLLALRGWAGAVWQLETNAEWTVHPAPPGSLEGFLAVRLVLERVACQAAARRRFGRDVALADLRQSCRDRLAPAPSISRLQLSYWLFQLAQTLGLSAADLDAASAAERRALADEVLAFDRGERERLFHLAYERRYRHEVLDAVLAHSARTRGGAGSPSEPTVQVITCLDDREESFRRHIEELDPTCETLGVAGFFGVAMYYRGLTSAHFRPLCPVSVKPDHFVEEEAAYSLRLQSQRQSEMRARLGHSARRVHVGTRSLLGGIMTALVGSLATIPMVMRVLFPRSAARLHTAARRIVQPAVTELLLEAGPAVKSEHGHEAEQRRYTVDEMADIVGSVLEALGISQRCAPLVVVVGHGSSSLNNPHEAAYDCGACGGGRGGPNARAFARMANDPRVRGLLDTRGVQLGDGIVFLGAYHNTCDDSVTYADLDTLPRSHRVLFERTRETLGQARRRNAHERCRRFESAPLSLSAEAALLHVEGRSADMSQPRPELGHATNALCLVGRRSWSRGLFLDRRAFLTSYDPRLDDARGSVLEGLLRAVIPVCAGINLEYYFSYVDPARYGCGNKLPHNITGLVGVMDGTASDLRPGLPWQMVEVHEPVRILFVIETTAERMAAILAANPALDKLVRNRWVQLAVLDAERSRTVVYRDGVFEPYAPEVTALPEVPSSEAWYRGRRDNLSCASIGQEAGS